MLIGYARVSTNEQHLDLQRDALIKAGVAAKDIYTDKVTGVTSERPGLQAALSHLRAYRLQRRAPLRGVLVSEDTTIDLRHIARNWVVSLNCRDELG